MPVRIYEQVCLLLPTTYLGSMAARARLTTSLIPYLSTSCIENAVIPNFSIIFLKISKSDIEMNLNLPIYRPHQGQNGCVTREKGPYANVSSEGPDDRRHPYRLIWKFSVRHMRRLIRACVVRKCCALCTILCNLS